MPKNNDNIIIIVWNETNNVQADEPAWHADIFGQ